MSELEVIAEDAQGCTRCELYRDATQTVFGEGPVPTALMLVGEQPGDQEDRAGRPFVGPAGRVLDDALEAADIARDTVYVTNAVKHFKWTPRGKRRIHQRPDVAEMVACGPWLELEIQHVRPEVVVALGAVAVRSLFGRSETISKLRGQVQESALGGPTVVTVHPASIVRLRDRDERTAALDAFAEDLRLAARIAATTTPPAGR
jgi:DNA polymerase